MQIIATGVYEHSLKDLAGPFTAQTGRGVSFIITNAGGVITKLDANAAADVIMTSSAGIDSLVAKGRILAASKVDVGGMRLGVAVGSGAAMPDITTPNALRAVLGAASAVASIDPNGGGTSGPFIDKLFDRLGVADVVRGKGVLCATGADVVRAVASGRASIGITQAAEAYRLARARVRRLSARRAAARHRLFGGGRGRQQAPGRGCGVHRVHHRPAGGRAPARLRLGRRASISSALD